MDDAAEIKPTIEWHQDGLEIFIYFIHSDDSPLSSLYYHKLIISNREKLDKITGSSWEILSHLGSDLRVTISHNQLVIPALFTGRGPPADSSMVPLHQILLQ